MSVFSTIVATLFGANRNVVRETAEVFRENTEAGAQRDHALQKGARAQFAAEFAQCKSGGFDRFMDGVNRLPRPMLALGTLGLMVAAMTDPNWFAARMQGVALVPEPLWWLLGIIVSFYFGARSQAKSEAFQRSIAQTLSRVPPAQLPVRASAQQTVEDNPALTAWTAQRNEDRE